MPASAVLAAERRRPEEAMRRKRVARGLYIEGLGGGWAGAPCELSARVFSPVHIKGNGIRCASGRMRQDTLCPLALGKPRYPFPSTFTVSSFPLARYIVQLEGGGVIWGLGESGESERIRWSSVLSRPPV
eukprot:scaffold6031_cov96-Isochrysis_galbana.AAC.1